jgi:hypothetical protein
MIMEVQVCKCCGRELSMDNFSKNAFGYTHVCKECNSRNRKAAAEKRHQLKQQAIDAINAKSLRLKDFTPRELMAELKERGCEGKLRYVQVQEIDLANL